MDQQKRRITDDIVIEMRDYLRAHIDMRIMDVATLFNVSPQNAQRALRGSRYAHLNHISPPIMKPTFKISDEQIVELRREFKENPRLRFSYFVEKYGISESTVYKLLGGSVRRRVNDVETPFSKRQFDQQMRDKARALYEEGASYNKIAKTLNIAKSSVSCYCRDLAEKKRETLKSEPKIEKEKPVKQVRKPLMAPHPFDGYAYYQKDAEHKPRFINLVHLETKHRLSLSYIRYEMCIQEQRILEADERLVPLDKGSRDLSNYYIVKDGKVLDKFKDMVSSDCVICGTKFRASNPNVKCCSKDCGYALLKRNRAAKPKPEKPVRVKPPRVKKPASEKPPKPVKMNICVICEEPFKVVRKTQEVCYKKECRDIIKLYT